MEHLDSALALSRRHGDTLGAADTRLALAQAWEACGEHTTALHLVTDALSTYRALRDPVRAAVAHNAIGWHAAHLDRYREATRHLRTALRIQTGHGNRTHLADTLDSLGCLSSRQGRHADALGHYRHALDLLRDLGDLFGEADTLANLGHAHAALGNMPQAVRCWRRAHELYLDQHRTAAAEQVRQRLDEVVPDNDAVTFCDVAVTVADVATTADNHPGTTDDVAVSPDDVICPGESG